ncbi:hypothetical protein B0H11DRAFT_2277373 [Mycena galericulata]|nr:hypothetical protein B0H11DRAFT_2277373 [Mycena galericulata]
MSEAPGPIIPAFFTPQPPPPHTSTPDALLSGPYNYYLDGRRVLWAFVFGSLGYILGVGLSTSWTGMQLECDVMPLPATHSVRPPTVHLHADGSKLAAPVVVNASAHAHLPSDNAPLALERKQAPPLLNGPPTAAFKDNLRPGVQYITSWPGSGWTNDVIHDMNLLYLAMITERIPVIPYFTPTHVGRGLAPTLAFGEVFDIPRLQEAIRTRILEWHQVKDPKSETVDTMGCWSVWMAVQSTNTEAHFTSVPPRLKIDVSYTTAPNWVSMLPGEDGDPHAGFWSLATLAFPQTRAMNLQSPSVSPIHGVSLPPEEQMLCYDYLYYVGAHHVHEWETDYSPAWRFVGRHMHWTPKILQLAERYVREAFYVAPYDSTPPYISVHVRHNDFANWCDVPLEDCFAPLSVIARRVSEVQAELWDTRRLRVSRVIVTSDEEDSAWWDDIAQLGWVRPDHSRTEERYGQWYPILIDAAIQSGGAGFVGTDRSTVSIIAGKRVATWQGGVVRMVRWGHPHADDH